MARTLMPEVVAGGEISPQVDLPLASEGIQRFVWRMAHGDILIEVRDGVAFVNGAAVEPVHVTVRRLAEDV